MDGSCARSSTSGAFRWTMPEFLQALPQYNFLQRALLAGLLAGIGCGLIGPLVVIKRASLLSGGIAHSLLAGVGVSLLFDWPPLWGALAAGLVAASLAWLIHLRLQQEQDVMLAALWPAGMAIGVLLISDRPELGMELENYLFGNILLVSQTDLVMMIILDVAIVILVLLFYRQLNACVLDEDFARSRGVPVNSFYLLLMFLVSFTVVLMMRLVGITLMVALLALPAATALLFASTLASAMISAILIGIATSTLGIAISYSPNLPAGATITLLTVSVYLLASCSVHWLRHR